MWEHAPRFTVGSQSPRGSYLVPLYKARRGPRRRGRQNPHPPPSKAYPYPKLWWMGVFDVCERPPIPHPKSYRDGLPQPRPVKSHCTLVQHSRFFSALVTCAENSRHLIGPATFLLLSRALANCSPRTAPIWSACSAASAARGRPLLFCDTAPIFLST